MVVHPRVRREWPRGGDRRRPPSRGARGQAEAVQARRHGCHSKEFIDELTKFRDDVIDHAEHEENEEFNKLERKLDAGDRQRMAKAVLAAEAIAPTRPHAGVESAMANFAVGPFASMLDRARDLIGAALR